jgi:hypothetical protein
MFGYTAEEVAGQWLPELIVPEELRAEGLIAGGTPELVLVSRYSGIGKASVVNELHKLLVKLSIGE